MHESATKASTLANSIDIVTALERDRETAWDIRAERDRAVANSCPAQAGALKRMHHWWQCVDRSTIPTASGESLGRALDRLFHRLDIVMGFVGLFCGAGLASAVLFYDGTVPVNIITTLGWLVLLPLVILSLSVVLASLPRGILNSTFNFNEIALTLLRRYQSGVDQFFSSEWNGQARSNLIRWRLLRTSQLSGLAFSIAALCILLVKVSFTDIAFAWSTTLSIDASRLGEMCNAITLPWRAFMSDAVPSRSLIENSRYFRLEHGAPTLDAMALTAWWQFLGMCLLVYGVAIRLIVLLVTHFRYTTSINVLLLNHSEVNALLDRMSSPIVSTAAESRELGNIDSTATVADYEGNENIDLAIRWNGIDSMNVESNAKIVISAGGERSYDEDIVQLKSVAPPNDGIVAVLTKAWEPPLLEFNDYLKAIREHLGSSVSIVVQPLAANGSDASEQQRNTWRRSIAQLGDARVYVK